MITYNVRTIHADGRILADLYAGTDTELRDRAVFRGMTAMADPASLIAAVDILTATPGQTNTVRTIERAAL